MTTGASALALLAASGQWQIESGLTDVEIAAIEQRFHFRLCDDHRQFLQAGLPVGSGWPDWRNADEMVLRQHIGRPVREILASVGEGALWDPAWGARGADPVATASRALAHSARVVPLYGVSFLRQGPGAGDPTVWAVRDHDVVAVSVDMADFARLLTDLPTAELDGVPARPFLSQPEDAVVSLRPMPAPPFRPDPSVPAPSAVRPSADPTAALRGLGIELPELTRHDDVLNHRAPMWSAAVEPGLPLVQLWQAVRDVFADTGLWPVLFTERTWHRSGLDGLPDEVPVLAAELDGARWLSQHYDRSDDDELMRHSMEFEALPDADWQREFVDFDAECRYRWLVLIPTPAHWYVPGLLQWSGAVNWDVGGADHAAILRRWSGRYGAELVALDDETMVLTVGAPPADPDDALEAAMEMYVYCDDSVNTQAGSLDGLAQMLTSPLWALWWD